MRSTPTEETLQGWAEDISHCTSWDELPVNARRYVERTPQWLGVGPWCFLFFFLGGGGYCRTRKQRYMGKILLDQFRFSRIVITDLSIFRLVYRQGLRFFKCLVGSHRELLLAFGIYLAT